jgi:hypothetical protein
MSVRGALAPCLALVLASACTSAPVDRAALRDQVRAAAPPALLLADVGPRALAAGDGVLLQVPCMVGDRRVATFDLADAYFKALFTTLHELRHLGFTAQASPGLWRARHEVVTQQVTTLTDAEVLLHLSRSAAPTDVLPVHRLTPIQLRELLASRRVLIAARSGLPAGAPQQPPSARRIRDLWFTPEAAPRRPLTLTVDVAALSLRAQDLGDAGELIGAAHLRFTLAYGPGGVPVMELETERTVRRAGSGLRFHEPSARYALTIGADDPLTEAIRRCVDDLAEGALPALEAVAR